MALLAGVAYDPTTAVSKDCASVLAMTAIDTTNLRLVFTAPSNGIVNVRLKGTLHGSTRPTPAILLGVLDGATIKGRMVPDVSRDVTSAATSQYYADASFLVTGLTPSSSYTWDAAYGVEAGAASFGLKYGGPNNTTGDDAFGSLDFEIWETANLLTGTFYDPATAVTKATTSLLAMTAMDTTNLRLTFTAPASGKVLARVRTGDQGSSTHGEILLGVLDGATVRARGNAAGYLTQHDQASAYRHLELRSLVTGLTPTTSYTWDAAYGVEVVAAGGGIKYGGPNNASADDAWGGIAFEIWTA